MKTLRIVLMLLSAVILAAHFSRHDMSTLAVISLTLPLLLFFRHRVVKRVVAVCFWLGALEWLRTMVMFVQQRQSVGAPWLRLAIILILMALLSGLAGWAAVSIQPRRQSKLPTGKQI